VLEGSRFEYLLIDGVNVSIVLEPPCGGSRKFVIGDKVFGKMALGVGLEIETDTVSSADSILLFAAVSAVMYFRYVSSQ